MGGQPWSKSFAKVWGPSVTSEQHAQPHNLRASFHCITSSTIFNSKGTKKTHFGGEKWMVRFLSNPRVSTVMAWCWHHLHFYLSTTAIEHDGHDMARNNIGSSPSISSPGACHLCSLHDHVIRGANDHVIRGACQMLIRCAWHSGD